MGSCSAEYLPYSLNIRRRAVPLYIEDNTIADLVARLATLRGLSEQDAVKQAVRAELARATEAAPLRDRFVALRAAHPLPAATGGAADRAFFDSLSGGL
ncbi:type II toxin-antitoxin system VapB family antitoxin [Roseomonas sp. BN140053]|uniref:type II toxin-antitoxin system VapB family antitoxin n=1 Tax=Roseomonas sp. BN140053 TaxID=3391898 RepID=UPI0039E91D13